MKYKALMLDIDGTLVPYDFAATPSAKVASAVKKASQKVHVSLVTGRAYDSIQHVLKILDLHEGYAVVNNGANVVDISTGTLLYDQPIVKAHADEIIEVLRKEKISFYVKPNYFESAFETGHFLPDAKAENVYMIYAMDSYPEEKVDRVLKELSHLSDVTFHKAHATKVAGMVGFTITHVNATKLHGIEVIMKQRKLKKEEIIGVGDSYNDFPLLMASGLKVAMGNAIDELKAIADYTAPSVTDDGVADVINKFILEE